MRAIDFTGNAAKMVRDNGAVWFESVRGDLAFLVPVRHAWQGQPECYSIATVYEVTEGWSYTNGRGTRKVFKTLRAAQQCAERALGADGKAYKRSIEQCWSTYNNTEEVES